MRDASTTKRQQNQEEGRPDDPAASRRRVDEIDSIRFSRKRVIFLASPATNRDDSLLSYFTRHPPFPDIKGGKDKKERGLKFYDARQEYKEAFVTPAVHTVSQDWIVTSARSTENWVDIEGNVEKGKKPSGKIAT